MLAFWSREGVIFLVLSSSSHLTMGHVFPLPVSEANWRSLFLLWGSAPPFPKMAPSFTGSAHSPFPGYKTTVLRDFWLCFFFHQKLLVPLVTRILSNFIQRVIRIRNRLPGVFTTGESWLPCVIITGSLDSPVDSLPGSQLRIFNWRYTEFCIHELIRDSAEFREFRGIEQ